MTEKGIKWVMDDGAPTTDCSLFGGGCLLSRGTGQPSRYLIRLIAIGSSRRIIVPIYTNDSRKSLQPSRALSAPSPHNRRLDDAGRGRIHPAGYGNVAVAVIWTGRARLMNK